MLAASASSCALDTSAPASGEKAAPLVEKGIDPPLRRLRSAAVDQEHLLITVELTRSPVGPGSHETRVLDARVVNAPLPRLRAEEPQPWRLVMESAGGTVLHEIGLARADLLHAPHAEEGQRGAFVRPQFVIALRVPRVAGPATLRLFAGSEPITEFAVPSVPR